jgi:20S proteasome subunit beta 3
LSGGDDIQVGGTAADTLLGSAETFYKKDMNPEELTEVVSQTLLSGVDRDIYSGWGGIVYTL